MVRWREGGAGSVNRKRTFDREDDAREFDRRVRRLKQTGDPALFADEITLRRVRARRVVAELRRASARPLDAGEPLDRPRPAHPAATRRSDADAAASERGRALRRRPRTTSAPAAPRSSARSSVLQGVMKRAVRDYNLSGNPVKQIDKPSQRREREPMLITVEQVEAMRLCVPAPRRPALGHPDQPARLRRPAPGVRGTAADLGRDPAPHDPDPSDQARRPARARDAPARPAGR